MIKKTLFVLAIGLFTFKHSMAEMLPAALPVPGGIAIINLKDDFNEQSKAYFGKKRVLTRKVNNLWQAMVGLPLKIKPGIHKIFTIEVLNPRLLLESRANYRSKRMADTPNYPIRLT